MSDVDHCTCELLDVSTVAEELMPRSERHARPRRPAAPPRRGGLRPILDVATDRVTMSAVVRVCPRQPGHRAGHRAVRGWDVDLDARLTRKQAAQLIGLPGATIGMWKTRGLLDTDEDGLYRWGDVLAVERETRRSPNSRRQLCFSGR
jgi:hypothetical protein